MQSKLQNLFLFFISVALSFCAVQAQQTDWDMVELRISHVAGSIYMLEGQGLSLIHI